jgi:hypothetical protein
VCCKLIFQLQPLVNFEKLNYYCYVFNFKTGLQNFFSVMAVHFFVVLFSCL